MYKNMHFLHKLSFNFADPFRIIHTYLEFLYQHQPFFLSSCKNKKIHLRTYEDIIHTTIIQYTRQSNYPRESLLYDKSWAWKIGYTIIIIHLADSFVLYITKWQYTGNNTVFDVIRSNLLRYALTKGIIYTDGLFVCIYYYSRVYYSKNPLNTK